MTQYYEAILQIRNYRDEVLEFVKSEIKKNNIKVPKREKMKNGMDIQLSSKTFATSLGKKLFNKFAGELKTSPKLVGRKNGKDLYRITIYYEPSEFGEGDIVEVDGKVIKVRKCSKFLGGLDVITRKNTQVEIKGKTIRKLKKYKTTISKQYPQLEVINPKTYQSVVVHNPIQTKNTNVKIVISKGRILLI